MVSDRVRGLAVCFVVVVALAICGLQQGCDPQWGIEVDQGITVFIHWPARVQGLIPSGTEAIRVTVAAADIPTPIVRDIARPWGPGTQTVDIEVPAGVDRVVTAEAFSATGVLLGRDSQGGVVVRPGETTDVALELLTNGTLRITIE